jgi:hypothetical protein
MAWNDPITPSGFLTAESNVKEFMKKSGYLWRTLLSATTTTPGIYEDVSSTGGLRWDGNGMGKITEIRNFIAENTAWTMEDTSRQPTHFDNGNTLAAGVRAVETGFAAAVKNSVSNIMTKWDAFIKTEAIAAGGPAATTKAYLDYLLTYAEWQTALTASNFGTDFLEFWRYAMRNELRVPIAVFTSNGTTWAKSIVPGTTTNDSGVLTYGAALEARLTTKIGGTSPVLATYSVTDNTGTAYSAVALVNTFSTVYNNADRAGSLTDAAYVQLGTKTNLVNCTAITSTVSTNGDVIAIYSV